MALAAPLSSCLCVSHRDANVVNSGVTVRTLVPAPHSKISTCFLRGSPLIWRASSCKPECRASSVSIRCEQSTKESNGLDVWLGRLAMVGFAAAVTVEITTGKGLLENVGLTAPLPTVALAITGLVGVLTAIFIFQSASRD